MIVIPGYHDWFKADKVRAASSEVDFGLWWTKSGSEREFPRWRVSWIVATGELYAVQPSKDHYILLGVITERAQVEALLIGWAIADSPIYHNLSALARRVAEATAEKT